MLQAAFGFKGLVRVEEAGKKLAEFWDSDQRLSSLTGTPKKTSKTLRP